METIKCNACGATLSIEEDTTTIICHYCGSKQAYARTETADHFVPEFAIPSDLYGSNITALLKRGFLALEDGEWSRADDFFERCLNQNAEMAEAYLGKLMVELRINHPNDLKHCAESFENRNNYKKILRFADDKLKTFIIDITSYIEEQNNQKKLNHFYKYAVVLMSSNQKDSLVEAIQCFKKLSGYLDSEALTKKCEENLQRIQTEEKEYAEKKKLRHKKIFKKIKISAAIALPVFALVTSVILILNMVIIPSNKYNVAINHMERKEYDKAIAVLEQLDGYKDSKEKIEFCKTEKELHSKESIYSQANSLFDKGSFKDALVLYSSIIDYKDSKAKALESQYSLAEEYMNDADYYNAYDTYNDLALKDYKDSVSKKAEAAYNYACTLLDTGSYSRSREFFNYAANFKDSKEKIKEATYKEVESVCNETVYSPFRHYGEIANLAESLGNYKNSKKLLSKIYSRIKEGVNRSFDTSGYTYCTVSDLYNNPTKYNGKKVFIISKPVEAEGFEPSGAAPYTDVLVSDIDPVNDQNMGFYEYYSTFIKPNNYPYVGVRIALSGTDVRVMVPLWKERFAVCGTFTYNPNYKEGGYITDPHTYHIEADYFDGF